MLLQGQGSPSTQRRQSQGSADWEIRTVPPTQQQSGGLSYWHTVMGNLHYWLSKKKMQWEPNNYPESIPEADQVTVPLS
jgi:hypothetical protein